MLSRASAAGLAAPALPSAGVYWGAHMVVDITRGQAWSAQEPGDSDITSTAQTAPPVLRNTRATRPGNMAIEVSILVL